MNATIEIDINLKSATPFDLAAALMHAAGTIARGRLAPVGLAHVIHVDGKEVGSVIAMPGVRLFLEEA